MNFKESCEKWLMKYFGASTPETLDFVAADTFAVDDSRHAFLAGARAAIEMAGQFMIEHCPYADHKDCCDILVKKLLKEMGDE